MKALKIVITGGPGSGKTSICDFLNQKHFRTYSEGARRLIELGEVPPIAATSNDIATNFGAKVLQTRISHYQDSCNYELCFFDRGIPDGLAFSYFLKKQADQLLIDAINNLRYDQVFILTPWRKIYSQDIIRQESYETAESIYKNCVKAYSDSGYSILEVPHLSVAERASFILNNLHLG
ncbi:MAG: ATP-binding protein [Bacteroidales bacterium]|nr:ATP-binding protein [Bacteroidales bacterium]